MLALIDYASKISIFYNQHYSIFSRVFLKIMPVCEFKTVLRFPTVCFSKKKTHKKKPNFILIVSKARDILYFELRSGSWPWCIFRKNPLHCSGIHLSISASWSILWVSYSTLSHSTMAETHALKKMKNYHYGNSISKCTIEAQYWTHIYN